MNNLELNDSAQSNLALAVDLLKSEEPVVAPTDTVYGLFGDAKSDTAIKKIYKIKGRPSFNPLIAHVNSLEMAEKLAYFSNDARILAKYFWFNIERPLTIVLPLKPESQISKHVTAGLNTIALRCPSHPLALELISAFGNPLAAPSANTSNHLSPTSADMVRTDLGRKVKLILDGGVCNVGLESTILNMSQSPYVLLRHGAVTRDELETILGIDIIVPETNEKVIAPGMILKHYAPHLPLRINVTTPHNNEAFIAFGKSDKPYFLNLSPTGDLVETAKNLFEFLYKADNTGHFNGIAIMPIPNIGIGMAINDRLKRAASH